MSFLNDIRAALLGWLDLLSGGRDVTTRFNATREGLLSALVFYGLSFFATMAVESAMIGAVPTAEQILIGLAFNILPLAGVAIAILVMWGVLRLKVSFLGLFVPAIYAMAFVILFGLPLALMFGDVFSNAMLGILGFMLYRLGREIGKMTMGAAIGFALLGVVALVIVPVGLYMLIAPAPPAA